MIKSAQEAKDLIEKHTKKDIPGCFCMSCWNAMGYLDAMRGIEFASLSQALRELVREAKDAVNHYVDCHHPGSCLADRCLRSAIKTAEAVLEGHK